MKRLVISALALCAMIFAAGAWAAGKQGPEGAKLTLTHADAAVILAKYSGLFDRYVDADAGLTECVSFLNKTGVYFGLMEVVNGSEFGLKDAARVFGQIDLVLNGEAEYAGGKVKLPKGIESWEEYCTMNNVEYIQAHRAMLEVLQAADARAG